MIKQFYSVLDTMGLVVNDNVNSVNCSRDKEEQRE